MGTPAVITFHGTGSHKEHLERHVGRRMDGDPITVFKELAAVVERASAIVDEHVAKHGTALASMPSYPSMFAGLYVGESVGVYGMEARIIENADDLFAEWRYNVNTDTGVIEVIYNEKAAVSPAIYIERLHEEYQDKNRQVLDDAISALAKDGYVLPSGPC